MPRTVSVRRLSAGVMTVKRPPTPRWCFLAHPSSTIAPSAPSAASVAREACGCLPLEVEDLADRRRIDGVDALGLAVGPHGVLADRRCGAHAGDGRRLARGVAVDRRPAVVAGEHVRGGDALLQRALRRVLQAGGDDRQRGDERHADGQRRGRDGRAARRTHGVAPSQHGRGTPRGLHRAPEGADDGPHDARRQAQPARGAGGVAQRLDRRDARRAPRRHEAGDQRHEHADQQRHDDRARGEDRAGLRQVEPERLEQRVDALGQCEAGREPDRAGGRAHDQRLGHDRAQHLAPRGAGEAQQPELARALGDHDRQGVEDRERPDQQRHAAEAQQHALDDRDEALQPVQGEAVLLGRGLDLGLRQRRGQVATHLRGGRAAGGLDEDRVHAPGLVEQALRGVQVEHRDRRGAQRVDGAERRDAGDAEAPRRAGGRDARAVADVQVLLVGGTRVDDDLAGTLGPRALLAGGRARACCRGPPPGPGRRRTTGRRRRPCRPCPGPWSRDR